MKTLFAPILLAAVVLVPFATPGHADVIVMTRNVLHGANFTPVIGAIASGDPDAIISTSATAYQEVQASLYSERANAIAAEIQAANAALVGLQEVGLFRSGAFNDTAAATQVEQDYLDTLMNSLSARGLNYTAVVVQENVDMEVPSMVDGVQRDLRFTNRNVILARTDLDPSEFSVSNPTQQLYNAALPIGGGQFLDSGYTAVDVQADGTSFRFINTHLESDDSAVRIAQGNEILAGPIAGTSLPVVLVGDLNTSGNGAGGTTYNNLINGGLVDAWTEVNPGQPGNTSLTGIFEPTPSFTNRIDFVLTSEVLEVTSAEVVGNEVDDRTPSGLWPSDHAGVVATIATVPEPSSAVVLVLATAGFAYRRHRKQQGATT